MYYARKLEEVEDKLADMCAKANYEKIKEEIEHIKYDEFLTPDTCGDLKRS